MPIKLENVGIAVRDLEATIAFFNDVGLTVRGRDTVSGEWTDTAVGLDDRRANRHAAKHQTAMAASRYSPRSTPTRSRRTPPSLTRSACTASPSRSTTSTRRSKSPPGTVATSLRGVATYGNVYKSAYLRGPGGIIVMLVQDLRKH